MKKNHGNFNIKRLQFFSFDFNSILCALINISRSETFLIKKICFGNIKKNLYNKEKMFDEFCRWTEFYYFFVKKNLINGS